MLPSLLIGTAVYILAQFVWYSPFGFGSLWSRYHKIVPPEGNDPLVPLTFLSPTVRGILLPALIISSSLHIFRVVMPGFSSGGFLLVVMALWLSVIAPKYLRKRLDLTQRRKWLIEDGALLWSILWVTLAVIVWWGNL